MYKKKTHKGLKKRVKLTARGKVLYRHPGASHLMSTKTAKRRRHLRRSGKALGAQRQVITRALSS